jgi:hypothetical protein
MLQLVRLRLGPLIVAAAAAEAAEAAATGRYRLDFGMLCCCNEDRAPTPEFPGIRGLRYARRKTNLQDVLAFLLAETSELCSVQIYQTLIASIFCSASVWLCLLLSAFASALLLSAWFCPALLCISTYARMFQQYYARLPTQPWPVPGRFVLESF